VSIITALLAESLLISVLAVALPLFVTALTVARYRFSGEQTSLIFIDVFMKISNQKLKIMERYTGNFRSYETDKNVVGREMNRS
jgi:ABC-type maltose transport system permease subunit